MIVYGHHLLSNDGCFDDSCSTACDTGNDSGEPMSGAGRLMLGAPEVPGEGESR